MQVVQRKNAALGRWITSGRKDRKVSSIVLYFSFMWCIYVLYKYIDAATSFVYLFTCKVAGARLAAARAAAPPTANLKKKCRTTISQVIALGKMNDT